MYRELIHGLQFGTALLRPKFPVSVYCCDTEARLLHSSMRRLSDALNLRR
jgi:hypothetical protein